MSKKVVSTSFLIILITLTSKFSGFLRDVVMAAKYGATMNTDAFIMAQSIIGIISGLALTALGTTFIPIMSDYVMGKSKSETNRFLNVVYTIVLSLTMLICILALIFTPELVHILAPGFSVKAYDLTTKLIRIMLPMIVLTALITLHTAKLQNHGSYLIPAAIGFPMNFTLIVGMLVWTSAYGIHGLAVAVVVGALLQVGMLLPFTRKLGYRFKIDFDFKEPGLRRIGVMIVPILIGSSIQQVNMLVDRILASGLAEGSIAALNFSNRLSVFVIGLLSAAVGSVYYTSMSNYSSAGQMELFKKLLRNTINVSMLLIIPASVGFIVLRLPIVQIVYQRGLFDRQASEMTAVALLYFTIGMVGFLLRDVLNRAFYALKDAKTAMVNGSIAVVLNIGLAIVLVRYLGIGGLALGTSISGIVAMVLLMVSLHRKIGDFGLRNIVLTLVKVVGASLVMAAMVYFGYKIVFGLLHSNLVAVAVSVVAGVAVYVVMVLRLKIAEVGSLSRMVRERLGVVWGR